MNKSANAANIQKMFEKEKELKLEEETYYNGLLPITITPAMLKDDTVHGFTWREMLEAVKTNGIVEEVEKEVEEVEDSSDVIGYPNFDEQ